MDNTNKTLEKLEELIKGKTTLDAEKKEYNNQKLLEMNKYYFPYAALISKYTKVFCEMRDERIIEQDSLKIEIPIRDMYTSSEIKEMMDMVVNPDNDPNPLMILTIAKNESWMRACYNKFNNCNLLATSTESSGICCVCRDASKYYEYIAEGNNKPGLSFTTIASVILYENIEYIESQIENYFTNLLNKNENYIKDKISEFDTYKKIYKLLLSDTEIRRTILNLKELCEKQNVNINEIIREAMRKEGE